jgi:hypothetical protein
MPKKVTRSDVELQKASKHLWYEWTMLVELAKLLRSDKLPDVTGNAYLESFAIHARALHDFLYPDAASVSTDVLARDYLMSDDWGGKRPTYGLKYRVNKEVAHLTYNRLEVTPEAKLWPVQELAKTLDSAMLDFGRLVPERLLCEELRQYLASRQSTAISYPVFPVLTGTQSIRTGAESRLSNVTTFPHSLTVQLPTKRQS